MAVLASVAKGVDNRPGVAPIADADRCLAEGGQAETSGGAPQVAVDRCICGSCFATAWPAAAAVAVLQVAASARRGGAGLASRGGLAGGSSWEPAALSLAG